MNLEEIKSLLLAKKKYLLIASVIIAAFVVFKKSDEGQVNNNQLMESKVEQSNSKISTQSNSSNNNVNTENIEADKTVTVDISGAVKKEGVYTLHQGARINELIHAAGGLKSNAQLKNVNRAIMLKDQDKIHIPYKGEKVEANSAASTGSTLSGDAQSNSSDNGEIVNINTATVADFQKLNGIGEKKAEQIVAYREQKGQFKKIEDLMQVSGIGEKTFATFKDKLAL